MHLFVRDRYLKVLILICNIFLDYEIEDPELFEKVIRRLYDMGNVTYFFSDHNELD